MTASLSISIVTFQSDLTLLQRTFEKLATAIGEARTANLVGAVRLGLIDNGSGRKEMAAIVEVASMVFGDREVPVTYAHGHTNIGYGAAHNLAMHDASADYHLVLNPDVELEPDALTAAMQFFELHPEIGAITPAVSNAQGQREYLCKRYPSVFNLLLRAFAPRWIKHMFSWRMSYYEMRDAIGELEVSPIPVMSGCFMLVRRAAIDQTGGFDPRFFLYFEDFDWSWRLNAVTATAYVPEVKIVHHGGGASRKGLRHIAYFVRSGIRFFNKHGWKWF